MKNLEQLEKYYNRIDGTIIFFRNIENADLKK